MSDFVYDGTTLPAGKSDFASRPDVPANKKVTAAEHNTAMQALYDLRADLLAGRYNGLTPGNAPAPVEGRSYYDAATHTLRVYNGTAFARVSGAVVSVLDFGAVGNGVTDDYAAFVAACSSARSVYVPPGVYRLGQTLQLNHTVRLYGDTGQGTVGGNWEGSSILRVDAGINGVLVNAGGAWSVFENLAMVQVAGVGSCSGIVALTRVRLLRCLIHGFSRDAVSLLGSSNMTAVPEFDSPWGPSTTYKVGDVATSDSGKHYLCIGAGVSGLTGPAGTGTGIVDGGCSWDYCAATNVNLWRADDCWFSGSARHGIYVVGPDSNAGMGTGLSLVDNGGWGVLDNSFLGNTYSGCHTSGNVVGPYGASVDGNANAANVFIGCYSEGGQPGSDIRSPGLVLGGLHGAGFAVTHTAGRLAGINPGIHGTNSFLSPTMLSVTPDPGDATWLFNLGGDSGAFLSLDAGARTIRFKRGHRFAPNAFSCNVNNLDVGHGWGWAGTDTVMAGRLSPTTALIAGSHYGITLRSHDTVQTARLLLGTVPVTADGSFGGSAWDFAPGDRVINASPVLGAASEWVCVTAGTPGTCTETATVTTNGTATAALSAPATSLFVGNWLTLNSTKVQVVSVMGTVLTLSGAVPAASGMSCIFAPPSWLPSGTVGVQVPAGIYHGDTLAWNGSAWTATRASYVSVAITDVAVGIDIPQTAADTFRLAMHAAAPAVFTAAPTLIAATNQGVGSEVTVVNDGAQPITFSDEGTLTGSGILLSGGGTVVVSGGDCIKFVIGGDSKFHEVWRLLA